MSTTTSNMVLTKPEAGDTDYPTSIDDSLDAIDAHDHTSGKGVQIPTAGIADLAVSAAKLASNAVTTAKILDSNVTRAKLASVGQQMSSYASFSTTNTSATDVTNLSVSITTTGRPVMLFLQPKDSGVGGLVSLSDPGGEAGTARSMNVAILRDATAVGVWLLSYTTVDASSASSMNWPCGGIVLIDAPAAGTYTYKVQTSVLTFGAVAQSIAFEDVKLVAFEL